MVPFTVDGLILAASMLILDPNRRNRPVPPLARWRQAVGIPTPGHHRPSARLTVSRQHSADINAWALGEGITISERSRIPATVVAQYEAASGGR